MSALVASVVLLALLLPAAGAGRSDLYYGVESLFRPTYVSVPEASGGTSPDRPPPAGFKPVEFASGRMQSPWVVGWSKAPASNPRGTCVSAVGRAAGNLVIAFNGPVDVDRVSMQAGLAHTDPRWSGVDIPETVDLLFDNNDCRRLTFADPSTTQQFEIHVKGVSNVAVIVIGVFPLTGPNLGATAITSVAFMRRR
jgi:hypothetical protein